LNGSVFVLTFLSFRKGNELDEYVEAQKRCQKQAPDVGMKFKNLVMTKSVVFRDVTPFFLDAEVVDPKETRKVILIRPRRWGKSVLGTAWIEFMCGREDLFVETWAGKNMREDKYIGIHLDLSLAGISVGECAGEIMDSINEGLQLVEKVDGFGEAAKGRRVSIEAAVVPEWSRKWTADWTVPDCTALIRTFLRDLKQISNDAGRKVAIFC
jgi:hypothetical protein